MPYNYDLHQYTEYACHYATDFPLAPSLPTPPRVLPLPEALCRFQRRLSQTASDLLLTVQALPSVVSIKGDSPHTRMFHAAGTSCPACQAFLFHNIYI